MVQIDPEDKKYLITFKPKDQRPNQRDDKIEIFRNIIGLADLSDILDITRYAGHHMHTPIERTGVTVTDINSYEIPIIVAKLTAEQANRIRRDPNVLFVEKDGPKQKYEQFIGYQHDHLRAPFAWVPPLNAQGQGVKVAIMDDGMYSTHPDLAAHVKVNQNFTGIGGTTPEPPGTHGTHCAGICGAINNNIGVVGTAPMCDIWNLKVLAGNQVLGAIVEATQYAIQNGAHILSQSYGSRTRFQAEDTVVAAALSAGLMINAAAGNTDPLPDGTLTPQLQMSFPAGLPGVNGISNTNEEKALSSRSNYGPQVDFGCPGSNINSTVLADTYALASGTSMACPAFSGVAAAVMSAYAPNACPPYDPSATKVQTVEKVIRETCTKTGYSQAGPIGIRDERFGWGAPQADKAVAVMKQVLVTAL